ncbi:DUF2786 domain-containing protein [Demequina phytophila]|uniref:DUF2786 domain-containing protein n=1 Tax=Demequina phytophila TaxID=1638981 RepID=UPI000780BE50|nr:DUF2786 domain-containing protein [Demequina phytophila]
MKDRASLLEQIQTLLRVADGGSPYPAERDLARKRAEKLMVRYAIDEAGVRMTREEAEKPTTRKFEFEAPYVKDQIILVCGIAQVFSCRSVVHGGRRVTSVGFASDLAMVAALVETLLPAMRLEMDLYGGSQSRKKAFAWSFTGTVTERLADFYAGALREAEEEGTGSALVLADRSTRVQEAYSQMFPHLRSARRRVLNSWEGWSAGAEAGKRADISLGRKVDEAGRRELPGAAG